jgi:acetylornithine deacetylase/succinyl-diaminopimelate desuccinylase-like protein
MKRITAILAAAAVPWTAAQASDFADAAHATRALLAELVAADTSNPPGNEARAAKIGAARLKAAGIPSRVMEFAPGRANLVARIEGDGSAPPLLMLAHIDVVGTEGQAWSTDPHELTEAGGYLIGRGVSDDLGMAALEIEVLILLHEREVELKRDVVVAWTGDEESGGLGLGWILENESRRVSAEIVLNEGGALVLGDDGRPSRIEIQTAEKIYQDFELVTRGTTGHSSVPLADNAISRLARGLALLDAHRFPARLVPVTRAYLASRASLEPAERAAAMRALADAEGVLPVDAVRVLDADPDLAATLRTTCVATQVSGGTRANALPAEARATVNCRLLPDERSAKLRDKLVEIVDDPAIEVRELDDFGSGAASPVDGAASRVIGEVAEQMWPGIAVVPFMSRGATDSRLMRARGMEAYGIDPFAMTEEDGRRAHGIDERIPAASLEPAVEFLYRVVVALASDHPE